MDMFNSYKIETVCEANVVDEDKIEDMVEDFLRKRDKKVYYDPLFKIAF